MNFDPTTTVVSGGAIGTSYFPVRVPGTPDTLGQVLGSNLLFKDGSGNVGLGLTNPVKRFHLSANDQSNCRFRIENTAGGGGTFDLVGGIDNIGQAGFSLFDVVAGQTRWVVDPTGSFLIGRTSTANPVTADGTSFVKNGSGGGMTTYMTNGGTGTALGVAVQADTTSVAFFRSGNVVGSIGVTTTATSYNTSSDYRLKKSIKDLTGSGDFIDALRPREGLWRIYNSPFVGFIAHEFAEVSPSSVTGEKDAMQERVITDEATGDQTTVVEPAYQSMQASSPEVMANIIAELQSLRKRVAELEAA